MDKLSGILQAVATLGSLLGPTFVHSPSGVKILETILSGLQVAGGVFSHGAPHPALSAENGIGTLHAAMLFGAEKGHDALQTPEGKQELETKVAELAGR